MRTCKSFFFATINPYVLLFYDGALTFTSGLLRRMHDQSQERPQRQSKNDGSDPSPSVQDLPGARMRQATQQEPRHADIHVENLHRPLRFQYDTPIVALRQRFTPNPSLFLKEMNGFLRL